MSRSFRIFVPLVIGLAIALVGCGKGEDKFVGSYTGKEQLSQKTLDAVSKMPNAAQIRAQMDKAQQMSIGLTLKKDKTATMSVAGQPQNANGTWVFENNQVVMTLSGAAGGPPMKLNPSSDGKTLTVDMSGTPMADAGTLVFTKS
jgi:hypothetical protein